MKRLWVNELNIAMATMKKMIKEPTAVPKAHLSFKEIKRRLLVFSFIINHEPYERIT